jgi:hypothetical protein
MVLALLAGCHTRPAAPVTYRDEPFGEYVVEIETMDNVRVERSIELSRRGDTFT